MMVGWTWESTNLHRRKQAKSETGRGKHMKNNDDQTMMMMMNGLFNYEEEESDDDYHTSKAFAVYTANMTGSGHH